MIGIYKITSPSGRIYIGQSANIPRRWQEYERLSASVREQPKIINSFLKYGVENHKFEVICTATIDQLDALEANYIQELNTIKEGLNCRCNGPNRYMDDVTRKKISDKKKGVKRPDLAKRNSENPTCKGRTGVKHPRARSILNTVTGIFYYSLPEAAATISMKPNTLQKMLSGKNSNWTNFVYA